MEMELGQLVSEDAADEPHTQLNPELIHQGFDDEEKRIRDLS